MEDDAEPFSTRLLRSQSVVHWSEVVENAVRAKLTADDVERLRNDESVFEHIQSQIIDSDIPTLTQICKWMYSWIFMDDVKLQDVILIHFPGILHRALLASNAPPCVEAVLLGVYNIEAFERQGKTATVDIPVMSCKSVYHSPDSGRRGVPVTSLTREALDRLNAGALFQSVTTEEQIFPFTSITHAARVLVTSTVLNRISSKWGMLPRISRLEYLMVFADLLGQRALPSFHKGRHGIPVIQSSAIELVKDFWEFVHLEPMEKRSLGEIDKIVGGKETAKVGGSGDEKDELTEEPHDGEKKGESVESPDDIKKAEGEDRSENEAENVCEKGKETDVPVPVFMDDDDDATSSSSVNESDIELEQRDSSSPLHPQVILSILLVTGRALLSRDPKIWKKGIECAQIAAVHGIVENEGNVFIAASSLLNSFALRMIQSPMIPN
eukprot:TRINITY_DN738_c0_g1_i3.p1 TRINITY_DN738_c0_g1~~TRINITY_DN738_c0_g1_i3.p1  ORF type:complete len:439 (-),score=131.99 TRINITY_DN738_c0_g1_i3:50-1366(-)